MKSRYAESFLFPNSQEDFRRPETFYPHQGLHGLDAVAPGYFEKYPDTKKSFEDQLAFYEKYLIDLKNTLANPGPYDTQSFTQSLIFDAETQIAYYKEQLRVENSLPNFNETVKKYVADLNAKAEAADAAARQASFFQSAADLYNEQGLVDAALQNQQMADDYARVAAEQQKMYAAAQASALDNIQKLSFTDYGLDTASIRSAAEAAGAAAFFADPDVQRLLNQSAVVKPSVVTTQTQGRDMQDTSNITLLALDVDSTGPILVVHYADGTVGFVAKGAEIDPWLTSHGYTRSSAVQTAAYANLLATQKVAVNTSTTTVQHVDTVTGTVSTGNPTTGTITVTTPTGQTVTGTGTVTAAGVTTTANPVTGTVTTTNPATGVVTQTDPSTGLSVQTVTAAAGGAGNIALFGLLGLLLLRGALK
jgi:hypothetical protein